MVRDSITKHTPHARHGDNGSMQEGIFHLANIEFKVHWTELSIGMKLQTMDFYLMGGGLSFVN